MCQKHRKRVQIPQVMNPRELIGSCLNKSQLLLTLGKLPDNSMLATLDVSSLYTNIPYNEGIKACDHFLRTRIILTPPFLLAHSAILYA